MAEPDAPGDRGDEAERDEESPVSDTELGASCDPEMELLRSLLSRTLGLGGEKPEKVLDELTLEGVSRFLRSERCTGGGGGGGVTGPPAAARSSAMPLASAILSAQTPPPHGGRGGRGAAILLYGAPLASRMRSAVRLNKNLRHTARGQ
ncbi:NAD-dependent protein deacetylase sirtuin-2 [Rissa tridactyla]|uniref:NAD-dependent protein deacetylase sirtuin-2 n=1 Tax=Rissa tridactyla TaxID=75485 RepID=UPI0023BA83E9|nr:NAD-dependent protein deacetylase sirtuin-2 [Rissa tridactyla]